MNKYNIEIEKDILKILKEKNTEERIIAVTEMINGTYLFEIDYLNKIPHSKMLLHLDKLIMVVTKRRGSCLHNKEGIQILFDFIEKIKIIDEELLNKRTLTTLRYDRLIANSNNKDDLKILRRASLLVLSIVIFLNLYGRSNKKEVNNENKTSIIAVEPMNKPNLLNIDDDAMYDYLTKEIRAFDEEKEKENIIVNYIDSQKPVKRFLEKEEDLIGKENVINEKTTLDLILEMYNLTIEKFNIVKAIVMAEAEAGSYEDGYSVINTMYNRTLSKKWIYTAEYCYKDKDGNRIKLDGTNLYDVAISPDQFIVYQNGNYKRFLNVNEGPVYDAIIDFLTTKKIKHNYLNFLSHDTEMTRTYEEFSARGNKYFNELMVEDRIVSEEEASKVK